MVGESDVFAVSTLKPDIPAVAYVHPFFVLNDDNSFVLFCIIQYDFVCTIVGTIENDNNFDVVQGLVNQCFKAFCNAISCIENRKYDADFRDTIHTGLV